MQTIIDQLTGHSSCMTAPRELPTLPACGRGWAIVGAAGARANIFAAFRLGETVTVRAALLDVSGVPILPMSPAVRAQVFHTFTGTTAARPAPHGGGLWLLDFDGNGDPLTVCPPPPVRDWGALVRVVGVVQTLASMAALLHI